jgi:hypothetical protein
VLEKVDQEEVRDIAYPEERIEEIKEARGKLRIFKERTEKEIRKRKEKAIEEYLKKAGLRPRDLSGGLSSGFRSLITLFQ